MSSAVAGKYQDHYQVLGVEFRADSETIQRAYKRLAEKFHPDNIESGDYDIFESINLAFEVLSDPFLRKEFDKVKGIGEEDQGPQFAGAEFFESFGRAESLRTAMLCILCDRRRTNTLKPGLLLRHVEKMLRCNEQELQFALWYLKFKSLVTVDDKSNLTITVHGVDYIENSRPELEAVLSVLRPTAYQVLAPAPASVGPETAVCYSQDGDSPADSTV